jgi:hypothetical protein
MIKICNTPNGWSLSTQPLGVYYSSLVEVMDAAYAAENRKAGHSHLPELRNSACHNCRFAKGG